MAIKATFIKDKDESIENVYVKIMQNRRLNNAANKGSCEMTVRIYESEDARLVSEDNHFAELSFQFTYVEENDGDELCQGYLALAQEATLDNVIEA
jgi:hypothetical protein